MEHAKIDGNIFGEMALGGLGCLAEAESGINAMNVFPVADGDTGTNMRLTLEGGIRRASPSANLGAYLKGLSRGMLLSARGNSGVIFSQLVKGVATSLAGRESADAEQLKDAFISAYRTAYDAVIKPVEGTILTVAREGADNSSAEGETVEGFFRSYVSAMAKSLRNTPEMLPVLKESGVLDSGGTGYLRVIEGMLAYLEGKKPVGVVAPDELAFGKGGKSTYKPEKQPHKPFGIIAVADGEGVETLFAGFGVNAVVRGGQTMNASAEELLAAIEAVNADKTVLFPNNPNILKTADQAAAMAEGKDVTVIPTTDFVSCYYALAMDIGDSENYDFRMKSMRVGAESVTCVSVTDAVRDYDGGEIKCSKGDKIAFIGKKLVASGKDVAEVVKKALLMIPGLSEKSNAIVIEGESFAPGDEDTIGALLGEYAPDAEVNFIGGGQRVYCVFIGLV